LLGDDALALVEQHYAIAVFLKGVHSGVFLEVEKKSFLFFIELRFGLWKYRIKFFWVLEKLLKLDCGSNEIFYGEFLASGVLRLFMDDIR
jgi:hypothetical protein